ncbi:unnamed protein product [Gordionus sp. m RMFG-2023]
MLIKYKVIFVCLLVTQFSINYAKNLPEVGIIETASSTPPKDDVKKEYIGPKTYPPRKHLWSISPTESTKTYFQYKWK